MDCANVKSSVCSITAESRRVVYYGGDSDDQGLLERATRGWNIPYEVIPLAGCYGWWDTLPKYLRSRLLFRVAHFLSPWVDAVCIALATRRRDLVLIKNHRSAIAYLLVFYPLMSFSKHSVVLPWFTLPQSLSWRNRLVYRMALKRARRVFIYTPKEAELYSTTFSLPVDLFALVPLHASTVDPDVMRLDFERFDVIMTGSTSRDWATFSRVCESMPSLRFAAIAPILHLQKLPALPNITRIEAVHFKEYCRLVRSSKIHLLLLVDRFGAVGQRDLLVAGSLERAVVATKVESLEIYCQEGRDCIFVNAGDISDTCRAIRVLFQEDATRQNMAQSLRQVVLKKHSLEAVANAWAVEFSKLFAAA